MGAKMADYIDLMMVEAWQFKAAQGSRLNNRSPTTAEGRALDSLTALNCKWQQAPFQWVRKDAPSE